MCLIIYTYILLRYCAGKRGVMNVGIDVHGGFSDGGSCDDARYCEYKFRHKPLFALEQ